MDQHRIRNIYEKHGYTGGVEDYVPEPLVIKFPTPSARLKWHVDARGSLIEVWRRSWGAHIIDDGVWHVSGRRDPGHVDQAYISTTRPGVIKGWHAHTRQTDRFVCVRGSVLVALCDLTSNLDPFHWKVSEVVLDAHKSPRVLTVPPGYAHGWMALDHADGDAWILNLCSHEYDGTDEFRRDPYAGPAEGVEYDWRQRRDG